MIKFGTGGWRDIIGENFTFDNVRKFSQGVAEQIIGEGKQKNGVAIGYDNRFMAEEFAKASAEIFAANNVAVYLLTPSVPTPMVNFLTVEKKTAAGLVFTASHNPHIYNGIKYIREGGLPATVKVTEELEKVVNGIEDRQIKRTTYHEAVKEEKVVRLDYHNQFIDYIEAQLDMPLLKSANLRVLYDPMFGTGVNSILTLLVDIRSHVKIIHDRLDPLFGGRVPAPTEETLWRLLSMMNESDYDIGIATDGDADRIAVVDEEGGYVHPNEILAILYYYLLKYKNKQGSVVRNLTTTHLLDDIAEDFGYECIEKPVGFKHIAEGLTETDAILGGEGSGGITLKGHLLEKDAILSAGLLLEMLAATKKSLKTIRNDIKARYGSRYFKEYNYHYLPQMKQKLGRMMEQLDPAKLNDKRLTAFKKIDGLKWEWQDGTWCCVRFSGTEPVLRIIAESPEEGQKDQLISSLIAELEQMT